MNSFKEIEAAMLVKCGRHCCICRRFLPQYIQVHHIIERGEGGTDDPDNLIPICITCHVDVHNKSTMTKRFSNDELKMARERVFQMVSQGTLRGDAGTFSNTTLDALLKFIPTFVDQETESSISPDALALLVKVVETNNGEVFDLYASGTMNNRAVAKTHSLVQELDENQMIEWVNGLLYHVTHKGYTAADTAIALANKSKNESQKNQGQGEAKKQNKTE